MPEEFNQAILNVDYDEPAQLETKLCARSDGAAVYCAEHFGSHSDFFRRVLRLAPRSVASLSSMGTTRTTLGCRFG